MKSAKVLYKIAYLIIVVLVAVFTVGYAFAWFFDRKDAAFTISGKSAGAYFESGDGSKETPFIISNPTHMHNLAVLQNMGKLDTKYYFEIKKTITEIDMSGRYIPPIGNDEHPFVGDFDGNGKTLANLNVTTNKGLLRSEYPNHARDTYEFSQAVGLFGMTGADSNIHNVILNNPTVDVSAATDTNYSAKANAYAGIAVGYVAGKVSSVGVRAANAALNVNKTGYSSFNSILGALADGVTSSVTGGGAVSGGDVGYGVPTDLKELYEALGNKDGSTIAKRMAFPFKVEDPALVAPADSKLTVTLSAGAKQVETATTQVATSSNIGYYVGSDIKGYNKPNVNYNEFYYPNNSSESFLLPYTNGNLSYPAPEQSVIDYLSKTGTYLLRMTGTTQVNVTNEDDLVVVPNGKVGTYSGNVLLPRRCIWVAPIAAGKLRFVFMNVESSSMGARILKLTRSTPKNYGTYFSGREQILEFNNLMLKGKAYYIEIPVTQDDIDAGYEYAVTAGDGYKPYFAFIDLGANGANIHYGQVDLEKSVSAVDFIYDGVEIKQADATADLKIGDFIVNNGGTAELYEASKTSIYFTEYNNVLAIVYLRLFGRADSKTINLVNYTSETIKDSGLKATIAQFVLPTGITGGSAAGGGSTSPSITGALSVPVGSEPFKLTANNISGTLTWTSSDESIATVDNNGIVTLASGAKAGDSFTITVTNADGSVSAQRTITVTATTVAAESVGLNKTSTSLSVGGVEVLTATVAPTDATNKEVAWKSSDESVATVDENGMITAIKEGTAIITATTDDGGFTAQCEVTVTAATGNEFTTVDILNGYDLSGKALSISNEYFTISSGSYKLSDNKLNGKNTLLPNSDSTNTLTVKADKDVTVRIKIGVSNGNTLTTLASTVTVAEPGASNKTLTFETDNSKLDVQEITLTLKASETATITRGGKAGRLNIVDVSYSAVGGTTPETPTVSDVTIKNGETANVVKGETLQLGATVTMSDGTTNNNVTWLSGNTGIATVDDNGLITAVGVGEVTVTATSTADNTQSASITITVTGFTVSYVINGHGTQPANVTDAIKLPDTLPILSEGGYTFDGWFTDSALTQAATAGAAISADTTLYAKWTEITVTNCTVTFNWNYEGAAGVYDTKTVASGSTVDKPTDPSRDGFTFGGWFTEATCASESEYKFDTNVTDDLNLYAKWTESGSTGETIYTFTAGTKASGPSCDKADGSVKLSSSGTTQQNGYIKLTKSSGSITFTITGLSAGKNVTLAFTDKDSGTSTANLSFATTNLTESGSGYTVTADGNIVITINATAAGDYYFAKCVVTIT